MGGLAAGFLPGEGPKARKLILDEFGRELDEEGNVVPMKPQVVSTLKVNINREKKLMTRRIKWTEDQTKDDDDDNDSDDEENVTAPKLQDHCVLIWEGVVKQRTFKNWKVTHARSEQEARKLLADRGAEHYWEMLARYRDPRMDI